MNKKIGFIGCGAVVQKNYFFSLRRLKKYYNNLYFFDLKRELAIQVAEKFGGKYVGSIDELILNSDLIIIATPPSTHFELICKALREGKDVICEKPFLCSTNEFEQLKAIHSSTKSFLYVGHFRRTFSHVQIAHNIIKLGLIGRVKEIKLWEGGRFNWMTESNYIINDPYGGVLFDTGSHTFDMSIYIANLDNLIDFEISEIAVSANKKEPSHEISGSFISRNSLYGQTAFSFNFSRFQVLSNKIEFVGENATLILSVGLNSKIKFKNNNGNYFILPNASPNDYTTNFTLELEQIFEKEHESKKFEYNNFLNLTNILETIVKKNGFEK